MQSFRIKSMRALAGRLGFRFVDRPLPSFFTMTCSPFDGNPLVWNVIEGQRNGTSVLVFDTVIGGGKGRYRTFIAVQTEGDPFVRKGNLSSGKTLQSNGWTAVYRVGLWVNPVGWTMSVQEIEKHLTDSRF